jgi:integrase
MLPTPQLLNQVASFIQGRGKFSYYCLFLLGKEAGLRVSEAVNFNLSLKKKSNLYLIRGKHHKKRAVFIEPQIIATLKKKAWKPQQTNRFSFAHFLQRTKKVLGISTNIELTPHTLRRCFATYQANSGMSLPILQKVLGHSSIRTTALYWKNSEDLKEKFISDKWLNGKVPKEPTKPIENKLPELPKLPVKEIHWKILLCRSFRDLPLQ